MILAQLQNFQWLNDPENVTFTALGMRTESKQGTDFWQNEAANVHKDNGHFFYLPKTENFVLDICWDCNIEGNFDQCGIMVRIDEKNWLKASVMFEDESSPSVATCATINGFSDWAIHKVEQIPEKVYYQIKRLHDDYIVYFSLDGECFEQIRLVHLSAAAGPVLAGAYICSPRNDNFSAKAQAQPAPYNFSDNKYMCHQCESD